MAACYPLVRDSPGGPLCPTIYANRAAPSHRARLTHPTRTPIPFLASSRRFRLMYLIANGKLITRDNAMPYLEKRRRSWGAPRSWKSGNRRPQGQIPRRNLSTSSSCRLSSTPIPHLQRPGQGPFPSSPQPHQLLRGAGRHVVEHRPAPDPGGYPPQRLYHLYRFHQNRLHHRIRPPRQLL